MLQRFYELSQREIATLLKRFLSEDFFVWFPRWQNEIAIVVEGSVANGRYDELSDIDLKIVAPEKVLSKYELEQVKEYKKRLRSISEPVQLHTPETFDRLRERLQGWENDGALRELSRALVLLDPQDRFKSLQSEFDWYPQPIFLEKVRWLFAEATFHLEERFKVAYKRSDAFFGEVTKIEIIRLLLNAYLLTLKRYPSFDKHLYLDVADACSGNLNILRITDELLRTTDLGIVAKSLEELHEEVQDACVERKFIPKQSRQYWIDARPKYRVSFN